MSTYSASHTGPIQRFGGAHSGFASAAYQCLAEADMAGETTAASAPAASAAPTKAARMSQFGRELRPR